MAAHRKQKLALWRRSSVRVVALLAAVCTIFAVVTDAALAYWTTTGTGTGLATSGTLNPPTAVTASSTAGTGSVHVAWTASGGSTAPSGYYVTREDTTTHAVSAACGLSASTTTLADSCDDSLVPLGTYTYTVVAVVLSSWTASSVPSNSVTVAQATQAITFTSTAPASAVVNGPSYTVTATGGGSGNTVLFSSATSGVCTVVGSTVTFQHAGTCTINADQAGSTYYSAAPTAQQSFSVAKATQTISFTSTAPTNATVGGPTYSVSATGGGSGNTVTFTIDAASGTVCSILGTTVSFAHVGTCVIDANQAGNADYLAAPQAQQSIAVGKGAQAISFTSTAPVGAQVGGSYTPTATSTSGLTVAITLDATSTGCTLTSGTVNFTAAGTCVVDANQAGNADYLAAAQMQQTFAISKVNQTISFTSTAPGGAINHGATYTAAATATSGLTVIFTSDTPLVCTSGGANGSVFTFIAAGTCTVDANQPGNAQFNAATQVQQSFSVGKGNQTITFNTTAPLSATVGGPTYTPTATATSLLTVTITLDATSTGCTLSSGVVSFTAVGTCKIDANQGGDANWNAATQAQQSIPVTNPAATHFAVSSGASQTAGIAFTVTITAQNASNATVTSYTGNHTITLTSTATNSPSGATPTLPSGAVTFTNGVATISGVKLVKAETARTITASDGSINGSSAAVDVVAGTASNVAFTSTTGAFSTANCYFNCTKTGLGNNATGTSKVSVTDSQGNPVTAAAARTVTITQTGSGTLTPASPSLTIAIGAAESSASFTWAEGNGNYNDVVTAASSGLTSVTASLSH